MPVEKLAVQIILGVSVLLQFWATGISLSMIGKIGLRRNWLLLSMAIGLMAFRRLISFGNSLFTEAAGSETVLAEIVALATSILLVMGLINIRPMIQELYRENDSLVKENDKIRENNFQLENFNKFIARSLHILTRQASHNIKQFSVSAQSLLPEARMHIKRLKSECATIDHLANGLLIHINCLNGNKHAENVFLNSLVRETTTKVAEEHQTNKINLAIDDDFFIIADPADARNLLENLIVLSSKSKTNDNPVTMQLVKENAHITHFALTVPGTALSNREIENLRQPFTNLHNYHDLESRSLELSVISSLVKSNGGRIWHERIAPSSFQINIEWNNSWTT